MFKQLKRRMMVINLSILTVLLLVIFSVLYITSYNNIQRNVRLELSRLTENFDPLIDGQNEPPGSIDFTPERSISFTIVSDFDGNVIGMNSNFGATNEYLTEAYELMTENAGMINIDDTYYRYRKVINNDNILYGAIDFTSEHTYLNNMIFTYLFVLIGSFIIVFVISSYLTNNSLTEVKLAFKKQKQFVANASHELKTPLAIISTNTDILLNDFNDNKWLNNIKYETSRMSKLTKDLLYLTKIDESTSKNLDKVNTNLSELVESTTLTFEALAYKKDITLIRNVTENINIDINASQINQVFHILLDNAIKYTNESGTINVTLTNTNNQVIYKIENTGDGINEEDIKNIFDRFYMGDKSRTKNDSSYGLGLSIASSIVRNHNAKISCSSSDGLTTFKIKF